MAGREEPVQSALNYEDVSISLEMIGLRGRRRLASVAVVILAVAAATPLANSEETDDSPRRQPGMSLANEKSHGELQRGPGLEFDRYVIEFELRVEQDDHSRAMDAFSKLRGLGSELIPHELWYVHATVCDQEGLLGEALESVNTYIRAAGRDGKHYRDALRLSVLIRDKVEQRERERQAAQRQLEVEQAARERLATKV